MSQSIKIGTLVNKNEKSDEYIRQILPHGFESFQIMFWESLSGTDLVELAPRVRDALGDSGAVISSLGAFGNPLGDGEVCEQTLACWEACIDHAYLFGAEIVAGFAGRVPGKSVPASIEKYKQVFGELSKRAADKGVKIAFENCPMDQGWGCGDWNIAINPTAWEMMFDALPADNIGLEWEPCHQMGQLIDPMPQLRKWIDKIFHVHGKDAIVYHDQIRKHGISAGLPYSEHRHPGFGDSNWTAIISELRRGGYTGSIDIEGWHDPVYCDDLEMTGQVHALNYLKQCRGGNFVANPTV